MSQNIVIRVTSVDTDDQGNFLGAEFGGDVWKVGTINGFIVLTERTGPGRIFIPSHRVREVEVAELRPVAPDVDLVWVDEVKGERSEPSPDPEAEDASGVR